jgi:hypothetical protein
MAAKIRAKSDPAFAAALAQVEPALAAWRQRRKHREPIPETLWRRMAGLARRYGLSPVAQALRVNYNGLKQHMEAGATAPSYGRGALAPAFVEMPVGPGPSPASVPGWVIELEDRGGSKLTLRLPPRQSVAALTVARGLWRHRA